MNQEIKKITVLLLCSIACNACSLFRDPEVPTRTELAKQREIQNPAADVAIEPFSSSYKDSQLQSREQQYGVELTWNIPEDTVDTFILYTGNDPENLDKEIRLSLSELTIMQGNKYRYLIKPAKKGEALFVSIAAVANGVTSPRSEVQKIEGDLIETEEQD